MQLECKPELALASELSPGTLFQAIDGGGRQRSDEELVIAAQSGESSALGELFGRHQNMLYCIARRYTANADEAHDLVQETMLRAFSNIGRFRRECRFASWLNTIVINTALTNKRREKHIRWIALDEQEGEETRFCMRSLQDVRRNPEEDYSHRELRGLLRREALKLHPKYRFILMACDLDDCSIKEVAHSLGMHLGTAKSQLHRARWSLSAAMKKSGVVGTSIRTGRHGA
jgi:RNA polymerase sigma-70 factor (ECF subfamily)